MNKKIKNLIDDYVEIEQELDIELKRLPNHNKECDCDNREPWNITYNTQVCLDCGGNINE